MTKVYFGANEGDSIGGFFIFRMKFTKTTFTYGYFKNFHAKLNIFKFLLP